MRVSDRAAAIWIGAIAAGVYLAAGIGLTTDYDYFGRLAAAILSTFGTTLFFSSVDGRAWYAAHAASMLFLAASFAIAARGGAPTLVGALLGISALARLPVAVAAPALALLTARRSGTPYRAALVRVVAGGL